MLSHSLVALALLLAASTNALHSHSDTPKSRKTLNFGYDKPHASFVTLPSRPTYGSSFILYPTKSAYSVAEEFVRSNLPESDEYAYRIREDSYTDPRTRVTHIYVKQVYRGLDVIDGDMNINVLDGRIISYGNEFFDPKRNLVPRDQLPLVVDTPADDELEYVDPRKLLLSFMTMATPSEELATSLEKNQDEHLEKVQMVAHDWLQEPEGDARGTHSHLFTGVPDTVSDVKGRMVYAQTPAGLELAWKFEVQMQDNWYDAIVSAFDGSRVLSVVDWASDSPLPLYLPTDMPLPPLESERKKQEPSPGPKATYLVFPWGTNDPSEGNRSVILESDAADKLASPYGWHSIPLHNVPSGMLDYGDYGFSPVPGKEPIVDFSTTIGNNVFAQENWEGQVNYISNYRPSADNSHYFLYTYDPQDQASSEGRMREARHHINATVTQLFYTTNMYHDLMYRYGFDEISGNFQQYNFERGGRQGDAVNANAQDGGGFNNANFMTPPDGKNGIMRMYLWNTASPYRDGDMEAGIIIHELSHGLSTRLTGGPANSDCLGWGEAGGMGEGWGDFIATLVRSTSNYSDYPMGAWASNNPIGIRNHPYSLNDKVNPETYKTVDNFFGVHPIGAVWAEILYHVSNNLIKKHGFGDNLFPPQLNEDGSIPSDSDFYKPSHKLGGAPVPKHGNTLILQLVVDGMKLQKCRPDFKDARDAIIQADEVLTGGENFCDLWNGFARKGLGVEAKVVGRTPWGGGIRTNGFSVPAGCKKD